MAGEQLGFGWEDSPGGSDAVSSEGTSLLPKANALGAKTRALAQRGIYLGTSSWKYPGWKGTYYHPDRYLTRGKPSKAKFNDTCLAEYARFMPTVCGDFAFYQFPSDASWRKLFAQVPLGFRMSLKIPEEITVTRWPEFPRYGRKAGTLNGHFMDASVLRELLLARLDTYRERLGVLIFQFGTIHEDPWRDPEVFAERLDELLGALPTDRFRFAVEVRNADFLSAPYATVLAAHGVAHCYNSWTRMPPVTEQLRMPELRSTGHVAARFLLQPGRTYAQAVERFEPYERIQDPYPEGRDGLRELIQLCLDEQCELYAWVNNRFEGNALETIAETVTLEDPR